MARAIRPLLVVLLAIGCASSPPERGAESSGTLAARTGAVSGAGAAVVEAAVGVVGTRYEYGGASPGGFDCSGLVVWAYARAGYPGLPHSAARLADLSRPVRLGDLAPGDLMIFELRGRKPSHVGIYIGDRRFVHAPSSGGRVEIVDFDHVYWRRHIGRAGRLVPTGASVARAH